MTMVWHDSTLNNFVFDLLCSILLDRESLEVGIDIYFC